MAKTRLQGLPAPNPKLALLSPLLEQAVSYLHAGRLIEAEGKAHEILAKDLTSAPAINVLGCVALARNQNEEALQHFERARVLSPRNAFSHFHLGEAHLRMQNYAKAARRYKKALKYNPDFPEAYMQLGEALRASGRRDEAVSAYRAALKRRVDLPNCWHGLALLMVQNGEFEEAARHFEAALNVVPVTDGEWRAALYSNVGLAWLQAGEPIKGIHALTQATQCAPGNDKYWRLLSEKLLHIKVAPPSLEFRETLIQLFLRADINPSTLATAAVALLKADNQVAALLAECKNSFQSIDTLVDSKREAVRSLVNDEIFLLLLSSTPIPDVGMELFLTGMRRRLLLEAAESTTVQSFELRFLCSLARQCFRNEYVYIVTDEEDVALQRLQHSLFGSPAFGRRADDGLLLAIVACYTPLGETSAASIAFDTVPEALRPILREQIEEPNQERALAQTLRCLKSPEDSVSLAVQSQYEENPFPRWTSCQVRAPRLFRDALRERLPHLEESQLPDTKTPRVLIAGCGTGLQTMNLIGSYFTASILAVDLSRRSLAYGMRKLAEYGVSSVQHMQADILDLELLNERFDVIESFGVLHHMRDPAKGLHILGKLLNPSGFLFLGLYSALARQDIVAARALIAERGYSASLRDIRAARRAIMIGKISELGSIANPASDFWTTSECRDLIFHTEEHRFALPEIDAILTAVGLEFLGLELNRSVDQHRFAALYPDLKARLALAAWHQFETQFPNTFGDTYRIWARKRV
jgi:tetratricopeptide (TPR) repeat protein/trans-aconitate methyltransferase